jgi:hypothetical protein
MLDKLQERRNGYEEDRLEDEPFYETVTLGELDNDGREHLRENMEEIMVHPANA